jgi:hypothetical protein
MNSTKDSRQIASQAHRTNAFVERNLGLSSGGWLNRATLMAFADNLLSSSLRRTNSDLEWNSPKRNGTQKSKTTQILPTMAETVQISFTSLIQQNRAKSQ